MTYSDAGWVIGNSTQIQGYCAWKANGDELPVPSEKPLFLLHQHLYAGGQPTRSRLAVAELHPNGSISMVSVNHELLPPYVGIFPPHETREFVELGREDR